MGFHVLAALAGSGLLLIALADAFDTIVLARRAERIFRLTGWFYALTWRAFTFFARRVHEGQRRERLLSVYGPLSLLALLALWALAIVISFTVLHWAAGLQIGHESGIAFDLFFSVAALSTMSPGTPGNPVSRFLLVLEAGLGISLLGLVVGYLPVLYQSFAEREQHISLLDARAGSPPAASELIVRQGRSASRFEAQLAAWERWAAGMLETQLSYPMLAYFRSQHENQSWLGALVTILDASSVTVLCGEGDLRHQAALTFAMCRHALADLVTVYRLQPPQPAPPDRLPAAGFDRLRDAIAGAGTVLDISRFSPDGLAKLRAMYEPFAASLSHRFLMAVPGWLPTRPEPDDWLRSSWDRQPPPYAVSDPFQAG
ncbi:MAG TPA: hypothetical protein VKX45_06290 [Bryobacteraceae bacterium]|jgi:hypothetical protein|nr:hypothetical protein [Bryobacteraceae bacterium]